MYDAQIVGHRNASLGIVIRLLEQADEATFVPFLGQHITDRCVKRHFDWLYRQNPHGHAITWLAIDDVSQQIVGCTSTFPRILRVDGKDVLASKGGDAYVDPDFRRRGIAQALHEQSIEDMRRLGVACNFGIAPVPANFRAFLRAGALSPGNFDHYRLPLDASWLTKRLPGETFRRLAQRALDPLVGIYTDRRGFHGRHARANIRRVSGFDSRVNELSDAACSSFAVCGKRDQDYLNWRFRDHPFNDYELIECVSQEDHLEGYAVLDMQTERCVVLDFLANGNGAGVQPFLKALIRLARRNGKHSIALFLNPASEFTDHFKSCGFVRAGADLPMMVLTIGTPEYESAFADAAGWYLTPGDQDTG